MELEKPNRYMRLLHSRRQFQTASDFVVRDPNFRAAGQALYEEAVVTGLDAVRVDGRNCSGMAKKPPYVTRKRCAPRFARTRSRVQFE